jgi:NTP pyrophosphatase (non-canonical NTP hydrolase)
MRKDKFRQGALRLVGIERGNQIRKWGEQSHPSFKWLAILMEEVGEVAMAILKGKRFEIFSELIQVAAVAVAWLEDLMWQDDLRTKREHGRRKT